MGQNPLRALALLALALNAINASDILTNPTAMAPVPPISVGAHQPESDQRSHRGLSRAAAVSSA